MTCVPDLFFSTVIDTAGVDLDEAGSGLMLNASELSTAVTYGINTTTVVFRNHSYGNVVLDLNEAFAGTYGTSLHNPDFIKFAESFGAVGMRANHPIPQTLERQAPVVIDVPLGIAPRRPNRILMTGLRDRVDDSRNVYGTSALPGTGLPESLHKSPWSGTESSQNFHLTKC